MRPIVALVVVVIGGAAMTNLSADDAATTRPDARQPGADLLAGRFQWTASPALLGATSRPDNEWWAVKDPSIVRHKDRWHLFCSVRGRPRSHAIEYVGFDDWDGLDKAERLILPAYDGFWCAPQVFYFAPQRKWYLICQASNDAWDPKYGAAFSTTADIADPKSWSAPVPLGLPRTEDNKAGLDFWVICDDTHAYLFFTTLDGRMWRSRTALADFPGKWSKPVLALRGDIFEASHTYRLKGLDKYLTVIEAQGGHGWRYYKAYLADRLDGEWQPLADSRDQSFASMRNVLAPQAGRWTDCISHVELVRSGFDEKLEVDPADLRVVFQGVLGKDRAGKQYGQIPWRLGLLTPAR